ncbi:hypothetical protein LPJ64_004032 [Coemansia asiatica]|uniref:Uncharacterized protein n=1 Tax=Coemansia asiatica TaxID=1052880 RepID=A0A9W7XJZ7_9FUNG|nr:hypothetical protein LPJ64_004032 [Coemansia asiatica]
MPDFDYEWSSIPKNPVFYPPTPKKEQRSAAAHIHESPVFPQRKRSEKLLSRIKTMFVSRAASALDSEQHPSSTAIGQAETDSNIAKLRAFRRSRLVARSPLREDTISPDLRALADIQFVPSPTKLPPDHKGSPHALYSSTKFYGRKKRSTLNILHFAKSVYSPRAVSCQHALFASEDCSSYNASSAQVYDSLLFAPHPTTPAGLFPTASRSLSLKTPSRHSSLMMHTLSRGLVEASASEHLYPQFRISRESEFTAIPDDMEIDNNSYLCGDELSTSNDSNYDANNDCRSINKDLGGHTVCKDARNDYSKNSGAAQASARAAADTAEPRISCSLSQRTLHMVESFLDAYMDTAKADASPSLIQIARADADVFDSFSRAARRPQSERFADSAGAFDCDSVFLYGGELDPLSGLPGSQRAMYMRSSCADSDLVKSTFDLAKLLPSAPK